MTENTTKLVEDILVGSTIESLEFGDGSVRRIQIKTPTGRSLDIMTNGGIGYEMTPESWFEIYDSITWDRLL